MFRIKRLITRVENTPKLVIENPVIKRSKPKSKDKFAKLDPIRFPTSKEIFFLLRAEKERESSGREVPSAIKVAPMKDSGIFNCVAKFEARTITILELIITRPKPKQKRRRNLVKLAFQINSFFNKLTLLFVR